MRVRVTERPDFRALLGETAWVSLPVAVRARFDAAAHLTPGVYEGTMDVRLNWLGWIFAQACRLIGSPLTPWRGQGVPVSVHVRAEPGGAIVWERAYSFPAVPR